MEQLQKHLVVVGTTAAGKSWLALELAKYFHTEIISLDSMQIYEGMEIGTGVVPESQRENITHHMIGTTKPTIQYSVSQFKSDVYKIVESTSHKFVFAGGTGLYTHAVVDNFAFAPTDISVRQKVIDEFGLDENNPDEEKLDVAYTYLKSKDSEAAGKIDPKNVRRIVRAIEAIWISDEKFSSTGAGVQAFGKPYLDVDMIGLRYSRDVLRERIRHRVEDMFSIGWVEECESLLDIWDEMSPTARSAIGYDPIVQWIQKGKQENEREQLLEHIVNKTAQFSRRQRKWFERDPRISWIDCDDSSENQILEKALALIDGRSV